MENNILTVNEKFCFIPSSTSIRQNQKALKSYSEGYDKASKLETETPIFLDTTVLLDYYKISFSEREQLQKFFETNKSRIYITKQIENEFLRLRIDHIKSYLKSLEEFVNTYKNIKTEIECLKAGEIKGFDQYLNNNPILRNDYQLLRNELLQFNETIKSRLKGLFQDSNFEQQIIEKEQKIEEIKKRLEGQADIERNDPLLDIIADFRVADALSDEEINFIKNLYDDLNRKFEVVKGDQNFNWKYTFPGCGEKYDTELPYGDFLIYHEMIKFMKKEGTDTIFLTNDVEKNYWLIRNKAELLPFTHYIVNTFAATEQTLYIFQAKDKIRVSYQPIYIEEKPEPQNFDSDKFIGKVTLPGPKILGKIDLPDFDGDDDMNLDDMNLDEYHFTHITEKEFMHELNESQKWAKKYGDDFVGVRSFITKYLGSKGYNFKSSFMVKDILKDKGLVEEYMHKATNSFYNDVSALKLTAKGLEEVNK